MKIIKKIKKYNSQSGIGMVEMIVVLSIITTAFVAIFQLAAMERNVQRMAQERKAAHILAREGVEAVRSVRDAGWGNIESLTHGTEYYLELDDDEWNLTTVGDGQIDIYTQYIVTSAVRRDLQGNISSSGDIDSGTVRVRSVVEWTTRGDSHSTEVETYLTNWREL